ncbi:hypothetical protein [Clostridium beijerinckii]|uniref:Uncharacterized protein n=1 Tax=Clostridium beijerinckii TaxID=1520 RepID=A0AAE5LR77_CLOBE|nr:hypothetical protein [Clostridium beijerinckii]NSB15619.1 hypothetical protein [Clostridium beijerinckii]OOM29034.1 hypothetical protein CLOBE_23910 [Clostridium beijerinckii]
MSLFLGKIHYWLFNKILWFEKLEGEIINLAKEEGLNVDELRKEINEKYGEPTPDLPLEEMIDTSNIHGWLQEKIHSAEGRMAAWTTKLVNNNKSVTTKLEEIYSSQGIKAASEVKEKGMELINAGEIFDSINDYILDGMPCDRVNEVIKAEEDVVEWKRRVCVHSDIWNKEEGDVDYFYKLRSLWVKEFVNAVNSDFEYVEEGNNTMVIRKK